MRTLRNQVRRGDGCIKFFRPQLGGERLQQEVFYLAYHLHWPWSEIMAMDTGERRSYLHMLARRIEQENEALEQLSDRLNR